MTFGYSPKFPLHLSPYGGYEQNTDVLSVVKQNFKMLLLTVPGERIMYPDLGVGFKKYLFESSNQETYDEIKNRIKSQANKYMPYIKIREISIDMDQENMNAINVIILYYVTALSQEDVIRLSIFN